MTDSASGSGRGLGPAAVTVLAVYTIFLSGCTVGPAYRELTPENFKDTDGWKQAQPGDATLKGNWWEMFNDTQLNALEEQVSVSNQNIAAAAANFLAARALVTPSAKLMPPTSKRGSTF